MQMRPLSGQERNTICQRAWVCLPLLDQEKVHGSISDDEKDSGEGGQSDHVFPQGKGVEAERAENRGSWDLDVEAIAVIDECQIGDFVDE